MGAYALYDLNITANDGSGANTAVGYNAGRGIVTGVNNTIIGANVTGLAAALSNTVIIADGAGGATSIKIYALSDGKCGFGGDTAPAEMIDVTGNINVTGVYKVADAQIAQANIVGLTTADGPTWDHVHITNNADVGGVYQVDSVKVVSNRQAAIAEPAETTAANTATIKYILDTLDAHGLLTAQEKILNGGFDSDTASWGAQNCTLASVAGGQSGNCLEVTRVSDAYHGGWQIYSNLIVGVSYTFSAYVKSGTSGDEAGNIAVVRTDTWAGVATGFTSSGSWVQYSKVFTAAVTEYMFKLEKLTTTAGTMLFDTASLKVTQ